MSDQYNLFLLLTVGLMGIYVLTFLYGMIHDLRRGRTGLLMILLAAGIGIGLYYKPVLAVVCAVLFAAAWIVGNRAKYDIRSLDNNT